MKKTILTLLISLLVTVTAVADIIYSKVLEENAIMGDTKAMLDLSTCYRFSLGVAQNLDKANYWLERSGKEGNANALAIITNLGNIDVSLSNAKRHELDIEVQRERERLQIKSGNSSIGTSKQTFNVNGVTFTMVPVQGGTFSDDKPIHSVSLPSYYIGQTEVTQELWEAVMGSNPSKTKGAKRPVENVSWNDCQEFISKLKKITGKNFRLPTRYEWEYAARGGNKSSNFNSYLNSIRNVVWNTDNSVNPHDVATKLPNELDLFDVCGNVGEWSQDKWCMLAPYLTDSELIEKLIYETYERMTKNVNVSHLMLSLGNNRAEAEAQIAKMDSIRTCILNGENFTDLVMKYSIDKSKAINRGEYGFIVSGVFPYAFEYTAFNTPVGQISRPIVTDYGIHLIKVNGVKPDDGQVEVAHILRLFSSGGDKKVTERDKLAAKVKIDSIYNCILNGQDFSMLAKQYSQDTKSASAGGKLPAFSRNHMVKPFEDASFSLKDGEISKPIETQFGYHIIKKISHKEIGTIDEYRPIIEQRMKLSGQCDQDTHKGDLGLRLAL